MPAPVQTAVHTFHRAGTWGNRVPDEAVLPGRHLTQQSAEEAGRDEAQARGVRHVLEGPDGRVHADTFPGTAAGVPAGTPDPGATD